MADDDPEIELWRAAFEHLRLEGATAREAVEGAALIVAARRRWLAARASSTDPETRGEAGPLGDDEEDPEG